MKEKKNISKFPKGFFEKERNEISLEESLKDIYKIQWKNRKIKK